MAPHNKKGPGLKKRSKVACAICRARKVRCDLVMRGGAECTNCFLDQKQCSVVLGAGTKKTPSLEDITVSNTFYLGSDVHQI